MRFYRLEVRNLLLQLKEVFLNDGHKLQFDYSLPMQQVELNGDYPFKSPVRLDVVAVNRAGLVDLIVNAEFEFDTHCDRCFTEITKFMQFTFNHRLAVSLNDDENDDYIETPDYQLDLDELATSDILLELPSKILCKDDCKGLCQKCGANLNEGQCKCNKSEVDSRLEILKQFID